MTHLGILEYWPQCFGIDSLCKYMAAWYPTSLDKSVSFPEYTCISRYLNQLIWSMIFLLCFGLMCVLTNWGVGKIVAVMILLKTINYLFKAELLCDFTETIIRLLPPNNAQYYRHLTHRGWIQHDIEHNTKGRKLKLCSNYELTKDILCLALIDRAMGHLFWVL